MWEKGGRRGGCGGLSENRLEALAWWAAMETRAVSRRDRRIGLSSEGVHRPQCQPCHNTGLSANDAGSRVP